MSRNLALILLLGMTGTASAGYGDAAAALKDLGDVKAAGKKLDAFLLLPDAALAHDAGAAALLRDNQRALELFKQAADEPNNGYLFAPREVQPGMKTPAPSFAVHIALFKLLLMDARVKTAQRQQGRAEIDLLAAAGFLAQLSAQRSEGIICALVEQLCMSKAYPLLSDSLRGARGSPAYLKELAARLDLASNSQDFMSSALQEELEKAKNTFVAAAEPEVKKLPFVERFLISRVVDKDFYPVFGARFDATFGRRTEVVKEAFRTNDPAPLDAFEKKERQELQARKAARSPLANLLTCVRGGQEARELLADIIIDEMLAVVPPSYGKLVPRYHLALCDLNVLRSAVAVKQYQLGRRRLPDNLAQLASATPAAAPRDPFNKFAPLAYARAGKKFLLYSFGPDGVDGKGSAALDQDAYLRDPASNAGDILFSD